ncbi:putative undecaprenyl-phosphate N-acetylglucosaminyl 1-phosphate transferase [Streptomyces sp. 111WW2]|nr:putative undecaprenyl-phosphate N-acetylglucosaminyl 1-phosphate transferase [Streptomyces sp. 111WW2]
MWRLRRRWLLAGTAVAAACVVPYGETGPVAGALAVGWVALVTGAFRGLDHADGVAGTVGVVTAFGVGACAAVELMDGPAVLLLVLAAALAGFLLHNWHPARIALGACGSLFTGFLLTGAAVLARTGYGPVGGAGVLCALTAVPVADAVLVLLSRRLAGRPLSRGGPDHLAHRLRRLGLTAQGVVVVLGGAALCAVVVGVLAHTGRVGGQAALWVAGGAAAGVLGLLRVRVYGPARLRRGAGVRAPVRRAGRGARAWAVVRRPRTAMRRPRTVVRRARAGVSQAPRGATGAAGGASFRAAIFPVRQATSTENVQVGAPLRVRNG